MGAVGEMPGSGGITVDIAKWNDALLDELRYQGDPVADDVASRYYDAVQGDHARLFRGLLGNESQTADTVLAEYYAEQTPLPDWVDQELLGKGADFFTQWGLEIGLGLFCFSLPVGYAAVPAARVLDLTARLETDTRRRVYETAQMVLDVTSPGALQPGQHGQATVRRVRLMHAGIRHLVLHDPRVAQVETPPPDSGQAWCAQQWGTPISQEHLVGALLTFGHSMLRVLDRLGVVYDEVDAEAYLHLWSVVGHLLGVRPDLLPIDRATGDRLDELVRDRNVAATAAGRKLTEALLGVIDDCGPDGILGSLPAATMRHLLGDEIADMLGIPPGGWVEHVLSQLNPVMRVLSLVEEEPGLRTVARWMSRGILTGFVQCERGHDRPAFAIPRHLNERWDLASGW
jgi:hypothetical protein